ncbi:helix-turn-helix domain-containing protein [Thioclava sp. DLFJ4-1]|uniref:helix-turn-helix domain-containing protein n=1 Tax=Thioclava sp. DLFJ4-1 TaxID=1915313 RepID=UPI000998DA97|nr:helix-turn-helix domain-containing protein [Thioclava sp. DLFJ4-1]OOY15089.1 hypothetical protein BMI85_16210 [Thioclava sp. DLFJ4-1]
MTETPAQIAARYGATVKPGVSIKRIRPGVSGIWDEFGNARTCQLHPRAKAFYTRVKRAMDAGANTVAEIAKQTGINEQSVRQWMQRIRQERTSMELSQ